MYNPKSVKHTEEFTLGREYAANIYKKDDIYTFNDIVPGSTSGASLTLSALIESRLSLWVFEVRMIG